MFTGRMFLKEQQGYSDIQELVNSGQIDLEGVKIVILVTGRAEVVAQHTAVINCV